MIGFCGFMQKEPIKCSYAKLIIIKETAKLFDIFLRLQTFFVILHT